MEVKYYENLDINKHKKSIFLAGPTPRDGKVVSWRKEAVEILEKLGFDGDVYVPECKNKIISEDYLTYNGVIDWELERLSGASLILFWVPRDLKTLPGFTTNVEFGYHLKTKKVVYARPKGAPKTKYLDYLYNLEYKKEPFESLEDALAYCCEQLR